MENFTTEIKPKDKLFNLDLKEVWAKKYLLWLFIKRDILVQFKQTIFGLGWYFISPLISTGIYIIIFSRVAGIPTDGIPQPLFYLSGVCLWNYFSQCLTKISETFSSNADLFGKVYFPRLIIPISQMVSHLFRFSIQMALFVVVYVVYAILGTHVSPNWYLLLFPVLVLMLGFTAMGLGLIITSMTTKYRDLKNFFGVFVSLWMYATPVVYPMSVIENETLANIMRLNPLTSITEAFKYGAMGAGEFSWGWLAYSFGIMVALLLIGILMFNRKQKVFIDTI
ncbi:MAG: ABC transporter permease [Bacteroidales bacterium]|nr:ABC transporter permease [Bacteroidales bacterium]